MLNRSHLQKVKWLFPLVALLGGIGQALALPFAYVTNVHDNSISGYSIDTTTGALSYVGTYSTGYQPSSVAITPCGKFAFVANAGGNTISAYSIDANTGALTGIGTFNSTGDSPNSIAIAVLPSGMYTYTANFAGSLGTFPSVSAYSINAQTGALTQIGPPIFTPLSRSRSITVTPDGKFAYVTGLDNQSVMEFSINASTGALVQIGSVPGYYGPYSSTVTPNGKFAYVVSYDTSAAGNVSAYTITNGTLGGPFSPLATGKDPDSIAVTPNGKFAYVANGGDHTVSGYTINALTGALMAAFGFPVASASYPSSIAVDPTGTYAYVTDYYSSPSTNVYAYNINQYTGVLTPLTPNNTFGNPANPYDWETYSIAITDTCTATPCATPPPGMVSWWPGDGNANDIAGGNDGVLNGSVSFPQGMVGPAFDFVAQGDYVEVSTPSGLDFGPAGSGGDLSIDAWIETSSGAQVLPIVDKRDLPGGSSGSQATGYTLFLYNGRLAFQLGDGTFYNYISSGPDLRNGHPHYVAVTVDRSSPTGGTLYVDGGSPFTFDPMNRPGSLTNSKPLFIGRHATDLSVNFIGLIDEVEIFNRALAPSEIQDIFNAGSAGKCKPTCVSRPSNMVAWWPLDETNGTTVADVSGYLPKHDGTPMPGAINAGGPSSSPAKVSDGFRFCGAVPSFVTVTDEPALDFGTSQSFSIDAWINTSSTSQFQMIVDKLNWPNPNAGYRFYVDDTNRLKVDIAGGAFTSTSTTTLTPGTWYFVAVTVNRSQSPQVIFYIDGMPEVVGGDTSFLDASSPNLDLLIGGTHETQLPSMGCRYMLDEVEIFSDVLTTQDIVALYDAGSAGKCKCLLVSDDSINCTRTGTFTYTFTVTNVSASAASGVSFSIPTGSGLTVTPGSFATPLPLGVPTPFTVSIGGAGAGANVCFDIKLTGQGAVICSTNHCVRLPKCPFPIDPIQLPGPAPIVGRE